MRSNMKTFAVVVAGIFLVAPMATADDVQEQLRLMEQRMAEMEDRLQATSDELQTARATVDEQQNLLSDAGLVELEDEGLRSGVGSFFEMVDISGVAAASYNHRLLEADNQNNSGAGLTNVNPATGGNMFKNPNANTFQVDQIWLTIDKAPTEESRGGFHIEYFTGQVAQGQAQGDSNDVGNPYLYLGAR